MAIEHSKSDEPLLDEVERVAKGLSNFECSMATHLLLTPTTTPVFQRRLRAGIRGCMIIAAAGCIWTKVAKSLRKGINKTWGHEVSFSSWIGWVVQTEFLREISVSPHFPKNLFKNPVFLVIFFAGAKKMTKNRMLEKNWGFQKMRTDRNLFLCNPPNGGVAGVEGQSRGWKAKPHSQQEPGVWLGRLLLHPCHQP